jgi:hypothetical protein
MEVTVSTTPVAQVVAGGCLEGRSRSIGEFANSAVLVVKNADPVRPYVMVSALSVVDMVQVRLANQP